MTISEIILSLLNDLTLLVTCTFLLGVLDPVLKPLKGRPRVLVQGLLFGGVSVLVMLNPFWVVDGVVFDPRGVVIVVVAALYGTVPAAIVCLFVIGYRLLLGGVGVPLAVGSALTCLALGIAFHHYHKRHPLPLHKALIGLGLATAFQNVFWLSLLPSGAASQVLTTIMLPNFLIHPLGTWVFGSLLLYQERQSALEISLSTERNQLRTLIDNVPDYIFIKDTAKRYILSNLAHAQAAGVTGPEALLTFLADHFFPVEYVRQHDGDDEKVLMGQSIIAQERQTVNADGTVIWVSTTKVPVRDAQGTITGIVGISRDITARKRLEEALQYERTVLRTLIDAVPANVYIKDLDSRFVDANMETIRKFGAATRSNIIGKTDFDFFTPELAAKYLADEQLVIQSGQPLLNLEEVTIDQRIAQPLWFLTTKAPILNDQGEVTGLVGIGLDITARKQVETTLQQERDLQAAQARTNDEMRQFLQSTLDAFPAMTVVMDRDGSILLVNKPWTQFADENGGQSSSYYLGSNYLAVCDTSVGPRSDEAERAAAGIRAVIEGRQESFYVEYPCPSPSEQRWFGLRVSPFSEAPPRRVVAAHINITERKQAEDALRESQAKLQTFFEVLPVGVSVLNNEGQIIEMNPALARILDISMEGLLNGAYRSRKYIFSDGRPFERSEFPSLLARVEQKAVHDTVIGVIKEDETTIWTSVSAAPLPGMNSGVITVTSDITERKQAESQAFALAAEQQRGKLLREFVTDISHDFRTPLSIIGSSAYLLGKTTDPAKRTHHSQRIDEQIARLALLMDSFVELVELEQQASAFQFQSIDLGELLQTMVARSQPEVQAKRQRFEFRSETDSARVLGDPTALAKAIGNIVVNAIRYTPDEGSIRLRLSQAGEQMVLEVADTGIGITLEDLPHIFESFYRVDSARSTQSGGAGLGLTIAKKLVELMKGRIDVVSTFGIGSVFRIYLPIAPSIT